MMNPSDSLLPRSGSALSPVRCRHCRRVYDLGHVEVLARYADCTVFKTPCCGRTVDDRLWTGLPAFTRLEDEATWADGLRARKMGLL